MADHIMTPEESAEFLANRPPETSTLPPPAAKAKAAKSADTGDAATNEARYRSKLARVADKPVLFKHIEGFLDGIFDKMKEQLAMRDKQVAKMAEGLRAPIPELDRRLKALERQIAEAKSPDDVSLAHRDASGNLVAEFWQRGREVSLRIGGGRTKQAIAGTEAAKKLLHQFEKLSPP